MPFSLRNTSEVSFQTWGLYKQKTTSPAEQFVLETSSSAGKSLYLDVFSQLKPGKTISQYEAFETLNLRQYCWILLFFRTSETTWGWRIYLQIAGSHVWLHWGFSSSNSCAYKRSITCTSAACWSMTGVCLLQDLTVKWMPNSTLLRCF